MSGHSTLLHICIAPPKILPGLRCPGAIPSRKLFLSSCLLEDLKGCNGYFETHSKKSGNENLPVPFIGEPVYEEIPSNVACRRRDSSCLTMNGYGDTYCNLDIDQDRLRNRRVGQKVELLSYILAFNREMG